MVALGLAATVAYTNAPLPVAAAAEWSTENAGRVATISTESGPAYESDGRLKLPANYREWIFLKLGGRHRVIDLSAAYCNLRSTMPLLSPRPTGESVRTGTWPDGTSLVLESRGATSKGSINQHLENFRTAMSWAWKYTSRTRNASRVVGCSSRSIGPGRRRRFPQPPLATPVTSSTPRLIRRSCSSIQQCRVSPR